jgi:hypothetical protein
MRGIWVCALIVAACGAVCFWWLTRQGPLSYRIWFATLVAAALTGWFATWAQIPLAASTEPINERLPQAIAKQPQSSSASILAGSSYRFDAQVAELIMSAQRVQINCLPLLDFDRVSPDGFWSVLAPGKKNDRTPLLNELGEDRQTIRYSDDAVVTLAAPTSDDSLRLTGFTPVKQDTYSHLNTYCYFEINGHRELSLTFSPCPGDEIEVLPADYPIGRPARLAYLDASQDFCVVEAASGEKGPYRRLAAGKLQRGESLTITVHDQGQPVAWIALEDWSRQVSTDLSPTAGWRVPVNAIEFRRFEDDPAAAAGIWITLAATPVGRGWDAVGHRAGVYRNTVVFGTNEPDRPK